MAKHPVFTRINDEITCHLLPYQTQAKDSKKQIAGIVGGRGCGKSIFLSAMALLEIIQGGKVLLLAQNYKSLRINLFTEVINRFRECGFEPEVNYGEMSIKFGSGALYGFSYEHVDSVRGLSEISMLMLDELGLAPANLFETANPCLRGAKRRTRILFATTPKKGSIWNKWFVDDTVDKDVFTATMFDNTELTEEEIELQKQTIKDPSAYRQEILGEILDDDIEFCIISHTDYPTIKKPSYGIRKLGIDLAGFGADNNVFVVSDESSIIEKVKIQNADIFQQQNIARELIQKHNVKVVNLDASGGFGLGLYDLLKTDSSIIVNPINFGQSAIDKDKYSNCRSEMYMKAMQKIRDGFYIDDDELKEELSYMSYKIGNNGKTQLESKSIVKELLGHSPDTADAFVLSLYDLSNEEPIYSSPTESLNIALRFASI